MKDVMKRVQGFLTFQTPLDINFIRSQFAAVHSQYQRQIPEWAYGSTKEKLIAAYWYTYVLSHFALIIGVPVLILGPIISGLNSHYLFIVLIVLSFTFLVLLVGNYWPFFRSQFLPKLEAVVSDYNGEHQRGIIREFRQEQERITAHFQEQSLMQQEGAKKCRQAQLSNLALTLVYYVLSKAAGIDEMHCDDHTTNLLLKLYGVDRGSLKTNLELIVGSSSKRQNLGERKCTEIRNRFDEAVNFLEEMNYSKGIVILKDLEVRIFNI
jgi:hypothetical protein